MTTTIVHAGESLPQAITGRAHNGSIFLAGALPRTGKANQGPANWRAERAYPYLQAHFDGVVLTPERRGGAARDYVDQASWERNSRQSADVIFYYLTRTQDVLALSTNTEFGQDIRFGPQRIVLCIPEDASVAFKTEFQQAVARFNSVEPIIGLEAGLAKAIELIGAGAERSGGECQVPLVVWRTASFQSWWTALKAAGNRLDGFVLEDILCPVPQFVLFWAAKVNIWVRDENRHKSNEWVISRPDIAHIVLVHRTRDGVFLVNVSEFRSTVRNRYGRVLESPGGSSAKPGIDPAQMGVDEVREETGIELAPEQVKVVGSRQLAATTTAHHALVLVAELTSEQFAWAAANVGRYAGNRAETERTMLHIDEVRSYLRRDDVDWSNLGMVTTALRQLGIDPFAL